MPEFPAQTEKRETHLWENEISAAVVNFQTPDLLDVAVRSFHGAYPEVPLLIIDNGSKDKSRTFISALASELGSGVSTLLLETNSFHGPAMHQAMCSLKTPYAYIFDSDTETLRGGFLEDMWTLLRASERRYGAGHVVRANRRGFRSEAGTPVLASAHMLLRRDIYQTLPPFIHHGLPALRNFEAAAEAGLELCPFPVEEYVRHDGRGTAARFGYGLGLRSRIDYVLNRLGL